MNVFSVYYSSKGLSGYVFFTFVYNYFKESKFKGTSYFPFQKEKLKTIDDDKGLSFVLFKNFSIYYNYIYSLYTSILLEPT